VYYATHDRPEMVSYKNKELRLMIDGIGILPDFIDIRTKKIIEFDGDYWHSNARSNPKREEARETLLTSNGYIVHRVREKDFRNDKQGTIDKCLIFLKP
jgi:very-short-patch-repair endonuclease